jgi:proto-oncogene tyrosine-protein kinase ROS
LSPLTSERREVELATLRELPGGTSFVHQSNFLYSGSDLLLDLDLVGVPKVNRNQITDMTFLGSGAFGEVYEGLALNLRGSGDPQTRVAIKTLRKGANTSEKQEFIQEAKLMAQFRHPHIIQLLGICVDTDPCYLLLELMGDGDLLSYLRSNRPHHNGNNNNPPLNLVDLLLMCTDVAKGCVYLEEMHFVHRDIAARNCLVSFVGEERTRRRRRVVKVNI